MPTGCRRIFIPVFGYLDADDGHRRRVDHLFEAPMIVLALLVLPVLGVEYLLTHVYNAFVPIPNLEQYAVLIAARSEAFTHFVAAWQALNLAVTISMAFIWLAFVLEFVIKISIAQSRVQYVSKNWLDLVIILLPMLRVFRGLRALRAARLARLSRVFTLRGVAMKLARSAIAVILGAGFIRRMKERTAQSKPQDAPEHDYTKWSKAALIAEIERLNEQRKELKDKQANT